jgi:hypothetical protein
MNLRSLLPAALLLVLSADATAAVRLRQVVVQPIAAPDHPAEAERRVAANAVATQEEGTEPGKLLVYPVGGTPGRDVAIPYYVDLDPGSQRLDFHCTDLTFNNHTGHDPYVRSFSEMRIGVPVFAVRDGRVIDVRDNEPDENTTNDSSARANYITLRHDEDDVTQYVHLRKGITLKVGDTVTAGTQIGWVGSSGMSMGPHIHFEARHNDVPFEPMAGPCRAGISYFADPPTLFDTPMVLGATFSNRSFAEFAAAPFDDAPHTGTFRFGHQTIYFKVEMANVGASTRYTLKIQAPNNARTDLAAAGTLKTIDVSLASIWWALDVDLDRVGDWAIVLEVNDRRLFSLPFRVIGFTDPIDNRAPNPVTVAIEPVSLRAGEVPVCRATEPNLLPDPDYDVVRYRYEWRVNGILVRDVTTAAQSDALARQHVTANAQLACSVTVSDGQASAQTVTAFSAPVTAVRRRATRP